MNFPILQQTLSDNSFAIFWFFLIGLPPLLFCYGTRNHAYWTSRGIPGPSATPFLGSFFSFSKPLSLVYQEHLSKYGKLFGVYQGQRPILILSDPAIIKRILVQDFALFRNREMRPSGIRHPITSQSLLQSRDEEWKRIRSILTPMFTRSKLKKMEGLMEDCLKSLLVSLEKKSQTGESFEARSPAGSFTLDTIAKCAFGTDTNAHEEGDNPFLVYAKDILSFNKFRLLLLFLLPTWLAQLLFDLKVTPVYIKSLDFFLDLSKHLLDERRHPNPAVKKAQHVDMLQLMVNAEHNVDSLSAAYGEDFQAADHAHHLNNGSDELEREARELKDIIGSKFLSEAEIIAQAFLFFLAGYETSASTLSFALFELAVNPVIQERLYAEIHAAKQKDPSLSYETLSKLDYLDAVLSETLRKYPPATLLSRTASQAYTIPEYGVTIEADHPVVIPVYAIHHSEEFFPNPELYHPERFLPENRHQIRPYTYLPFGGGPRNCIGMRFALTEAKLGLARLLDQFRVLRVPETTDKLELMSSLFLLKTSTIQIGVQKRTG